MPDIETLLRFTLAEHADQVAPRAEAIHDAVAAVHRRRRWQSARRGATGAAAAAAVGAIALSAATWHPGPSAPATGAPSISAPGTAGYTPAVQSPSPTATTSTAARSSAESTSRGEVLASAFGSDYTAQRQSPSGFGGDLTLTPGSPSAAGLPAGYEAAVTLSLLAATSDSAQGPVDTMTSLCAALVEKGATMNPCVPERVGALTVQRAEVDAPNTKVGTWANLRILYLRPDKRVQYAEVTIWNTAHTTTAQERATAAVWLHAQNAKVTTAATAPLMTALPEAPVSPPTVTAGAPASTPASMQANGNTFLMSIGSHGGTDRLLIVERVDPRGRTFLGATRDPSTATLPEVGFGGANAPGVYFGIFPEGAQQIDPIVAAAPGAQATVSTMPVVDPVTGRRYVGVAVAVDPQKFPDPSTAIASISWTDSAGQHHRSP